MKNKEKYSLLIADIAINNVNGRIAINKRTGAPVACYRFDCDECLFGSRLYGDDCKSNLIKWAEAEYKEPLSAKTVNADFHKFCRGKKCTDCKYVSSAHTTDCQILYVFDNYNVTEKEAEDAE